MIDKAFHRLAAGCVCGALAWSTAVWGATETADSSPAAPAEDSGIHEIVVTAQRREERLQDVPISVTAVDSSMLERTGVESTQDLTNVVPGLTILSTAGFAQPRLRGIGNNVFGAGYEGGVATYIDGVYLTSAPASLMSLSNIERIEVLKGPQGTLFGRNATGGLIQIITRDPQSQFGGNVSLTAADYQTFGADAYVTGGLVDGVAADFAGHVSTQGQGYGINVLTGREVNRTDLDLNLRSSLLAVSDSGGRVRITGDYERTRGSTYGSTQLAPGTGAPFPTVAPGSAWNIAEDVQPSNDLEAWGVAAHLDQDLPFAHLASITAYRRSDYEIVFDGDVTSTRALGIYVVTRDQQFSQELQLVSRPASFVKWVTGLYYLNTVSHYDPSQAQLFGPLQPLTPLGPVSDANTYARLGGDSISAYGQATVPLEETTNLTLGARYTSEKHDISAHMTSELVDGAVLPGAPIPDQSERFSKPTWRVSLDHRFWPELMVYASYNRGFKSGGYNGQFPTQSAFAPEVLDAYELGWKSDLASRRVRVNGAFFYYNYSDIQVSRFIGNQVSYYNGAAAKVYGFDADFEVRVTRQLTLSGGLTLLHDRFTDFPNAVISTQVPTGIIVSVGSATGNRLPMTPDVSGTLTADYQVPLRRAALDLDASYNYDNGYFSQPDNILRQPAYRMISAGARLSFPDGFSVRFWGNNLADAKVATTLAAGTFNSNAAYMPPRTFGVTVGFVF
ncbi:MAG TPA: TonB-dependent receptor [Steroidobacteraceae bacterium]|nr:TonB-dependent receptor [Steroidobacteraceae bacterium]